MKSIWYNKIYVCLFLPIAFFYSCSQEVVEVGCVGTYSGSYSDLGVEVRNGVRLAEEEINADAKRYGFKVKVYYIDDEGTEEGVRKAAELLIRRNVRVIIGPVLSTLTGSIIPRVCKQNTIWISPVVSSSEFTGQKDCFFRTISDSSTRATKLAEYIKKRFSPVRLCVVIDQGNRTYTEDFARHFFKALGLELKNHPCLYRLEEHPSLHTNSVIGILNHLIPYHPDAVLLATSALDTAIVARSLIDNLPQVVIAAPLWAKTGAFLSAFGLSDSKIFFEDIEPGNQSPDLKEFLLRYETRYGFPPSFAAVQGYDTMKVVAAAVMQSRTRGSELETELSKIENFPGLLSPISIDEYGDARRPTFIYSVCRGKFCEEGV
ncbi:ABC transporter substrate-binding protein [Thermodesulforhabdus norvegica]|uniref:Amino acid/amide ABC transporter substrate-binding protein, HAAT family n=1 Tax=Thermodesulforhabdus norvegica TaxID=39841 RepID=A0A1I4W6B7_9BACT|nr:ABC transporter substrate-binding protein [Thermodesulforhabdus norvegica]SFN08972.1 amino acid/amide ABC transporter substrate-binding protein, HAAT family [Thermodesulforhabdus norvegica]